MSPLRIALLASMATSTAACTGQASPSSSPGSGSGLSITDGGAGTIGTILVIVVVAAVILILGRNGWNRIELPWLKASKDDPETTLRKANKAVENSVRADAAEVHVRALKIALEQFDEVAAALAHLIESGPNDDVDARARQWFTTLSTRLAMRLKEQKDHHYRVAIWADDPKYPNAFVGIGHGLFDPADTDMDFLEREYTIGGLAFRSSNMAYYCRDRETDSNFRARRHIPPSFDSVFGLALGTYSHRWGVMTVDARQRNGFDTEAQWLIQRFGNLASLGAVVWQAMVTPPDSPSSATSAPEDASIVAPDWR